jgi:Carboxypeptidase regulatory-like domain
MPTPKTFTFARGHLRSLVLPVACILFAALLLSVGASAQEFRGTISGTVTDSTGAIIKDAQVTVTETNTGTINRTKTDSAGQYVVPFLQPGTYQIVVEITSFKKDVRNGITLQANEHPIIDMALQVGNAQ